MFYVAE